MANRRIYYAIQQVQIAPLGTAPGSYTASHVIHGLQTAGINTTFNLEQIFEIGQLAIYENIEEVPDIEVTLEKVLDGYPIIYHLATNGAPLNTLAGRSNQRSQVLLTIYDDTKSSATGVPITEVECSGMYVSQVTFNFPVDGNCSESVTLVGNNKVWRTTPSGTGQFPGNNDVPIGTGGVQRRENVKFGTGQSVIPPVVDGISMITGGGYSGSGYNLTASDGVGFGAHIQSINISCNMARENLLELGRKVPYHRYLNFPVEITTDIETISTRGDLVNAYEDRDNLTASAIIIKLDEGLIVDLGTQNKLNTVSYTGGDAGAQGSNVTVTYSFQTFNDFIVRHPRDPSGFAYPG